MKNNLDNLEWNVFYEDWNQRKITTYNAFNHFSFNKDIKNKLNKCKTKEEFSKVLRSEAMYYFWSRSEWEIIIEITDDNRIILNPWIGYGDSKYEVLDVTDDTSFDWKGFADKHIKSQVYGNKAKVDVFSQLDYVWDDFVTYCWNNLHTKKSK